MANKFQGLFIGLTTIDIQYFVEEFPKSNVKIKTAPPEILVGGPATNAAVAFAYLNNHAFLASPVGENSFTSFTKSDFVNTKISHIDLVEGQYVNPVIASVITSNKNGDRNIFTHNPNSIDSEISVKQLFTDVKPEILLLDGFFPEFSIECSEYARSNNIPVILDGGSWKPQYNLLIDNADIIICSEDFYPPNCNNSNDVIQYLQNRKIKKIAITRGEKNIVFQNNTKRGEVEIENIMVKDTLGAGDFLHGAFCYYYLESKNFELALQKASEVASYSCKYGGTRKWLNVKK